MKGDTFDVDGEGESDTYCTVRDYIKENSPVSERTISESAWYDEVYKLKEKGLVEIQHNKYGNEYHWIPDDAESEAREFLRKCSPVTRTMARKKGCVGPLDQLVEEGVARFERSCWYWDGEEKSDSEPDFGSITIGVDFDEGNLAEIQRRAEMMAHHAAEVHDHLERMDEHREALEELNIEYDISIGENDE